MRKLLLLLIVFALALPMEAMGEQPERSLICIGCKVNGNDAFYAFRGEQEIKIIADSTDHAVEKWIISPRSNEINAATNRTCPGGMVSFGVQRPKDETRKVDYWVIDGVKYKFQVNVIAINVEQADR